MDGSGINYHHLTHLQTRLIYLHVGSCCNSEIRYNAQNLN